MKPFPLRSACVAFAAGVFFCTLPAALAQEQPAVPDGERTVIVIDKSGAVTVNGVEAAPAPEAAGGEDRRTVIVIDKNGAVAVQGGDVLRENLAPGASPLRRTQPLDAEQLRRLAEQHAALFRQQPDANALIERLSRLPGADGNVTIERFVQPPNADGFADMLDAVRDVRVFRMDVDGADALDNLSHALALANPEIRALEREAAELARSARGAEAARRKQLERDLERKLDEAFDKRLEAQAQRLDEMNAQAEAEAARLEERKRNKDEIIDRRMKEMLGEDNLDW